MKPIEAPRGKYCNPLYSNSLYYDLTIFSQFAKNSLKTPDLSIL